MHERQRYEKQTDRLGQSWFSKTKNDEIAGVSAKRGPGAKGPGRPFGDFSDGAEKSLGPEAEIPRSPFAAVGKEGRSAERNVSFSSARRPKTYFT